jgi:hypothetical protein
MPNSDEIIIRTANAGDYADFRRMEEIAWQNSGIEVIGEDMFRIWLDVFPEGFFLAVAGGEVVGHVYGQICDFDPLDQKECKNLHEMTDHMFTIKTHNPAGNCLYSFSISCILAGAAVKLNERYTWLAIELGKPYYSGAMRMPGLARYMEKRGIKNLTGDIVHDYASRVRDTIRRINKGEEKVFDPVISTSLRLKGSDYSRVIENFFPYPAPQNWGCVLYWSNPEFGLNKT